MFFICEFIMIQFHSVTPGPARMYDWRAEAAAEALAKKDKEEKKTKASSK